MKFSLLMSIYDKEQPNYFNRAMESIWDEQSVKPNEIILVQDGELTEALYASIDLWQKKIGSRLKSIILEKNVGLGAALNVGVQHCSHTLIARMDTDDIAIPNRFEKQLDIFKNKEVDVCSGWVSEFEHDETDIISFRKVPELHASIHAFSKKRNPMNHPAVMYKKSLVEAVGGYQSMLWFEDYYLWARMLMYGAIMYNIQETLVHMRAGYAQLQRRSGWRYAVSEFTFQKALLEMHFLNHLECISNITIRIIARLIPKTFLKIIYKRLRD